MKYYFILNPLAGAGTAEAELTEKIRKLSRSDDCILYKTKAPNDASDFVRQTISEHPEEDLRFIACGGDGTVNEVFSGAVGAERASVSVWPCGSGNDFVKVFGAERFLDLEALLDAPSAPMDALKVSDRYSFNVTNFGFDTTVAITINNERAKTGHGNKNAYTKGVVTALLKSMNNRGKIWADGELLNDSGRFLLCTCANGQYVGGSFRCAPRAKIDDGLLEVCVIRPISRIKFVTILDTYTKGQHLEADNCKKIVTYRQAKKVHVEAPEGFAYSLDGEIIYENVFDVEIVPGAVNLAVPK